MRGLLYNANSVTNAFEFSDGYSWISLAKRQRSSKSNETMHRENTSAARTNHQKREKFGNLNKMDITDASTEQKVLTED